MSCPTVRRFPRTLADAFRDERAVCIEHYSARMPAHEVALYVVAVIGLFVVWRIS